MFLKIQNRKIVVSISCELGGHEQREFTLYYQYYLCTQYERGYMVQQWLSLSAHFSRYQTGADPVIIQTNGKFFCSSGIQPSTLSGIGMKGNVEQEPSLPCLRRRRRWWRRPLRFNYTTTILPMTPPITPHTLRIPQRPLLPGSGLSRCVGYHLPLSWGRTTLQHRQLAGSSTIYGISQVNLNVQKKKHLTTTVNMKEISEFN